MVEETAKIKFATRTRRWKLSASLLALSVSIIAVKPAVADEGGVSFWVPGFFGSLAATPQQPGFSFATIYYHTSVSAGGNVAFARQVSEVTSLRTSAEALMQIWMPKRISLWRRRATYLLLRFSVVRRPWSCSCPMDAARYQSMLLSTVLWDHSVLQDRGSLSESATGFGDIVPQFNVRLESRRQ